MTGMSNLKEEVVSWQQRTLRKNHEVRIKIVEVKAADSPKIIQNGFAARVNQTNAVRKRSNRKRSEYRRAMGQLSHVRTGRKFSREELDER